MKLPIDWEAADAAANRIVFAYEIADVMSEFSGEYTEQQMEAITVLHLTTSFALLQLGVNEKQAVSEFARAFRTTRRAIKRAGADPRLRDVITEMHLDHRNDRNRRATS